MSAANRVRPENVKTGWVQDEDKQNNLAKRKKNLYIYNCAN